MGSITNKINKKIEVIASILGALGLIYLSYPIESNIKRILLNPFFQITWLLIIVWIYNSFNRHIAMIMGILFVGMRVFLKGKFIETFENNEKNNEKNIKAMNEQSKIKLAQLQLDKSKYPLADARIEVMEVPGSPGSYQAVAHLRPWLQFEELTTSMRLVARIPKKTK